MASRHASFNPRPPLLAGESHHLADAPPTRAVSIRARHCWRANPDGTVFGHRVDVFQSAPAIAGGRIPIRRQAHGVKAQFQSAPAIAGGRITYDEAKRQANITFQSAPAIAGGRIRPRP